MFRRFLVALAVTAGLLASAYAENISLSCALGVRATILTLGTPVQFKVTAAADSGVKSVAFKGLPAGLKYDKKTGFIAGTPKKAGTFKPIVTVVTGSNVRSSKELGSVRVPEFSNIVVGTYHGNVFLNGKPGVVTMKIAKNGKTTGKIVFGDRASLGILSGYFMDAYEHSAEFMLNLKDGSQLMLVFQSVGFGDADLGYFIAATDASKDASSCVIVQDPFLRADTRVLLPKLKKHVFEKNGLTFTVSPKGAVKVKGTSNGTKFAWNTFLVPLQSMAGYFNFYCYAMCPQPSLVVPVQFAVDSNGTWYDDL